MAKVVDGTALYGEALKEIATLREQLTEHKGYLELAADNTKGLREQLANETALFESYRHNAAHAAKLDREALEAERDTALAKLKKRTGCVECKGRGYTERHQPGHVHYETDAGEACPPYHFERIPCECSKAAMEAK